MSAMIGSIVPARLDVRAEHVQRVEVAVVLVGVALRELARGLAPLVRAVDDLVVDVRDVADVGDLDPAVLQVAQQQVGDQGRARVADVAEVVDRGAAAVEPTAPRLEQLEGPLLACEGVVDDERGVPGRAFCFGLRVHGWCRIVNPWVSNDRSSSDAARGQCRPRGPAERAS